MEYENHADLVELAGKFLLPQGPTKPLRILLDLGATNNFINSKLQQKNGIKTKTGIKKGKVTVGDSITTTTKGETLPIIMINGNVKHKSTYTLMDLGKYDVVLGMPFINNNGVKILGGEIPEVTMRVGHHWRSLPLRIRSQGELELHFMQSTGQFIRSINPDTDEIFQIIPKQLCTLEISEDARFIWNCDTKPKKKPKKKIMLNHIHAAIHKIEGKPSDGSVRTSDGKPTEFSLPSLSDERGLKELVQKYKDVFPADLPAHAPPEREISMRIPIKPGSIPPCQAPYRMDEGKKAAIEATIKYLYEHGLSRDSLSEYAAPVTLALKPDGSWRFCVDYRKLNAITKEAKYPLPRIEDCLDQLRGAKFFTKIDLRSGYWQVRIHPDDVEKSAFRTHMGHHEFLVVPFGLQGAPSLFQRLMNHYLRPYLGKYCMVYLDDIIIYSKTREEHLQHLETILQLLRDKKLYAKGSKCEMFRTKVLFLGYIVEDGKIHMDPDKVKAITEWIEPKNVREVRSFLGLCNFYRKFVEKYAEKAKPLTDILKSTEFEEKFGAKFAKKAPVTFGEKEKAAFQTLKDAISSAPCLAIYDPTKPTETWADASWENKTVGAVLLQNFGNGLQPIAFMSKVMNAAQSKYPTFEQELLALKLAFEEWRHYLLPLQFIARTDHNGLKYLRTQKHLSERQWHWLAFFSEFYFDLQYRPGKQMQVPDALSRRPNTQSDLEELLRVGKEDDDNISITIPTNEGTRKVYLNLEMNHKETIADLEFKYENDIDFGEIYETLKNKTQKQIPPSMTLYHLNEKDQLIWVDKSQTQRICVPKTERLKLIKENHDTPIGGHFGTEKTYERLRRNFYWPNMRAMINSYVTTCDQCQKHKHWTQSRFRSAIIPDVPMEAWESVSIDFCGPFPKTKQGYELVCAISCNLTNETIFVACKLNMSAADTAELYKRHVFRFKGLPKKIISDRGPQFIASFWENLWKLLDTNVARTAPYHPQSNPVERQNKTFQEGLRSFVNARQDDWDERLILFEFAFNDTMNPSTGSSPFYLNLGRHPRTPVTTQIDTPQPAVYDFITKMQNDISAARDALLKSKAYNADHTYKDFQIPEFKVGDKVLLHTENLNLKLPSKKLQPIWIGPLTILQLRGPNTVLIEVPPRLSKLEPLQNVQYLKPYKERPSELGEQRALPTPELIEGVEEFEVDDILTHRYVGKQTQYLVRFTNCGPEEDLWLPARNLANAPEIVSDYWTRQKRDNPKVRKRNGRS